MGFAGKRPRWRIGYVICCLVYAVWIINLSANDFDRVHRQYRETGARLTPSRSREIARQELIADCREEQVQLGQFKDEKCLSVLPAGLEQKEKTVVKRLTDERHRALRKLIVFYATFVVIFLLTPPLLVYGLIIFFINVFLNVKVVK
ncbi:MAG: hypothetical protein P8130_01515 [Deltaproteobacteria bacterium]